MTNPAERTVRNDQWIGPFQACDPHRPLPQGFTTGYDPRLRRDVWIQFQPVGTPAVSPSRRDSARPTRQRWLSGRRGAGDQDNWDAYEAIDGVPIVAAVEQGLPWTVIRGALADLASELEAADGAETFTHIDQVWLAASGVKVVEPAPSAVVVESTPRAVEVMAAVLRHATRRLPPPVHTRLAIEGLMSGRLAPAAVAAALRAERPIVVTLRRRLGALAISGGLPLLLTTGSVIAYQLITTMQPEPEQQTVLSPAFLISAMITTAWLLPAGIGVLSAALCRGGLALRLCELLIVTADGMPAGRVRAAARALLAWAPVFVGAGVLAAALVFRLRGAPVVWAIVALVFVAGVAAAVASPARGWQDRLTGTWITPR